MPDRYNYSLDIGKELEERAEQEKQQQREEAEQEKQQQKPEEKQESEEKQEPVEETPPSEQKQEPASEESSPSEEQKEEPAEPEQKNEPEPVSEPEPAGEEVPARVESESEPELNLDPEDEEPPEPSGPPDPAEEDINAILNNEMPELYGKKSIWEGLFAHKMLFFVLLVLLVGGWFTFRIMAPSESVPAIAPQVMLDEIDYIALSGNIVEPNVTEEKITIDDLPDVLAKGLAD